MKNVDGDVVIEVSKKIMGVLWGGGNATLYFDAIEFRPNLMNDLLHRGETSWRVPLREVVEVSTEFGFITRIIRIRTNTVSFKIRCYKADEFAAQIDRQRKG